MALGILHIGVKNIGIMEKKVEATIVYLDYIGNTALGML